MYGTQVLGHLGDHTVNLLPAGDVGDEREDASVGLAAQLAGGCLQISPVPRDDRHVDPFPGQFSCDGFADPPTTARHDGPLALQSEVHGSFLTVVRAPVFRSTHQALFSHQGRGASATPYLVRSPGRHIVMDRTGVSPRAAALTGGPDYE
jgi:hypothetical protein